jgi:Zn-dependent M28 family amino/carboxypeptidase
MMGKTIFPGANDNASGVAMMLDLANYFSKNPPKYSIAFMAFAGEEPGLVGSKAYTGNPWDELPLGKMKFLVNLDLMGSGEKGMAVVNATIFTDYYAKLQEANNAHNYLPAFKMRGKAANSDHYWFVERDVKGFFFYLMGSYSNYHDVQDNSNNLKLGEYYDKSFLLIRDFIKSI